MANRCWTSMTITGPQDQLERLNGIYQKLDEIGSTTHSELMRSAGISEADIEKTYRRGCTTYHDYDGQELRVDQDDAWEPCFDPLLDVLSKLECSDLDIRYVAIEPGCGIFESNDDEYIGKYLVDVWEPEKVPLPFKKYDYDYLTESELRNSLKEWKQFEARVSLKQILSAFLYEFGDNISINKIEYEPIMAIG